jgi:hypothetical protein
MIIMKFTKGGLWGFTLSLITTLVLIGLVIMGVRSALQWDTDTRGVEKYQELAQTVNGMEERSAESSKPFNLFMVDNSFVVGMSSFTDYILQQGVGAKSFMFPRPNHPACQGSACMCYCQWAEVSSVDAPGSSPGPGARSIFRPRCKSPLECKQFKEEIYNVQVAQQGTTQGGFFFMKDFNAEEFTQLTVKKGESAVGVCQGKECNTPKMESEFEKYQQGMSSFFQGKAFLENGQYDSVIEAFNAFLAHSDIKGVSRLRYLEAQQLSAEATLQKQEYREAYAQFHALQEEIRLAQASTLFPHEQEEGKLLFEAVEERRDQLHCEARDFKTCRNEPDWCVHVQEPGEKKCTFCKENVQCGDFKSKGVCSSGACNTHCQWEESLGAQVITGKGVISGVCVGVPRTS